MRRTSGPGGRLMAGAHLAAGGFLVHAATVTVHHGGAAGNAAALYAAAGLALAAAYRSAAAPRRRLARTRPGTELEDAAALNPPCARCERWWITLGAEHDTWCSNYRPRQPT